MPGAVQEVTSCLGAIFAPDHRAVAAELRAAASRWRPAAGPVGSEDHVRDLFGDRVDSLELSREECTERSPGGPEAYCDFFKETFGPLIGLYAGLSDRPEQAAALDRDFLDFATRFNQGAPGAPAEYRYEYLLVVAQRAGP